MIEESLSTKEKGKHAEEAALKFLLKNGLTKVTTNYALTSGKKGEIDLIMKEGEIYVFVEVRLKKDNDFCDPIETITRQKQNRIIHTATWYLLDNNLWDKVICRFDVIGMTKNGDGYTYNWIQNAFE